MAVQAVDTPSPAMPREARSNLERPGVLRRYPQFTISPAILVALIAAWWLATDVAGVPAYVMPPPEQVHTPPTHSKEKRSPSVGARPATL